MTIESLFFLTKPALTFS